MVTLEDSDTAKGVWERSCYFEMNFIIPNTSSVYKVVQKISVYDVGCLITTNTTGHIGGVISDRDFVSKIALLGRKSKDTLVKEISTKSANLIAAAPKDSIDGC